MSNNAAILLQSGMEYYGLKEVPGSKSNPYILEIINKEIPWAKDDSAISWCAIFITHLFRKLGWQSKLPLKPYGAREWKNSKLKVVWDSTKDGKETIKNVAKPGYILIFKRGTGWTGHLTLFINLFSDTAIRCFGGNQEDAVNIRHYSTDNLLYVLEP
jgi:uncharacterized protein (TIGR02594 family)